MLPSRLMRILPLSILAVTLLACSPKPCPCDASSFKDDEETLDDKAAASSGKDACQRAADHLTKSPAEGGLGCKQYGPDFAAFCRDMEKQNVPVCPLKLAKVKTCAEANTVCTKPKGK